MSAIVTKSFRMSKGLYRTSTYPLLLIVYLHQIALPDLNRRVQNVSYPQKAFPYVKKVYNPKIEFPGFQMRVQNVYQPHLSFRISKRVSGLSVPRQLSRMSTRIQIVSHPLTAFLDVKTNVYNPIIAFPGVQMRVQKAYHRHVILMSKGLYGTSTNLTYPLPIPKRVSQSSTVPK